MKVMVPPLSVWPSRWRGTGVGRQSWENACRAGREFSRSPWGKKLATDTADHLKKVQKKVKVFQFISTIYL
jgi:hypothetical protein